MINALQGGDFNFFDTEYLRNLAVAASNDTLVAQNSKLAKFRMGFRNKTTGSLAWLSINGNQIESGLGDVDTLFCFEGDAQVFEDLQRGYPFNRLVRQHRLIVVGDLRSCVQNWLLIYAITRLTFTLERDHAIRIDC